MVKATAKFLAQTYPVQSRSATSVSSQQTVTSVKSISSTTLDTSSTSSSTSQKYTDHRSTQREPQSRHHHPDLASKSVSFQEEKITALLNSHSTKKQLRASHSASTGGPSKPGTISTRIHLEKETLDYIESTSNTSLVSVENDIPSIQEGKIAALLNSHPKNNRLRASHSASTVSPPKPGTISTCIHLEKDTLYCIESTPSASLISIQDDTPSLTKSPTQPIRRTPDTRLSPLRKAISTIVSRENNTIQHAYITSSATANHPFSSTSLSPIPTIPIENRPPPLSPTWEAPPPPLNLLERTAINLSDQLKEASNNDHPVNDHPVAPPRKKRLLAPTLIANTEQPAPTAPPRRRHLLAPENISPNPALVSISRRPTSLPSINFAGNASIPASPDSATRSPLSITLENINHLRKLSHTSVTPITAKDERIIQKWLIRFTHENNRRNLIKPERLIAARKEMEEIYDKKKGSSWLWSASTTHAYRQKAQKFYEAAGISRREQRIAALHWAKSGEFYAFTQAAIFPLRLYVAALDLPAFESHHADVSLMLSRAGLHSSLGGLFSPTWDSLSSLAKRGQPVPSTKYWETPLRRPTVSRLKQCIEQTENMMTVCKNLNQPIPDTVKTFLEETRHLYKMVNAKGYCYAAGSSISGAVEVLKTIIDMLVIAKTAGMATALIKALTRAGTAIIYAVTSPFEEWATMDQIRTQNAKYADIFKEGSQNEVDLDKVMALWQGSRQTENIYIEKAVGRRLAKYINTIQEIEERVQFLEVCQQRPDEHTTEIFTKLTACRAKIDFIEGRVKALQSTIKKSQSGDATWLTRLSQDPTLKPELLKELGAQPATNRSLLKFIAAEGKSKCTGSATHSSAPTITMADRLQVEGKKYASLKDQSDQIDPSYMAMQEVVNFFSPSAKNEEVSDAIQEADSDIKEQHTIEQEMRQAFRKIFHKLQHLSNGKSLVAALERDLEALQTEKIELEILYQGSLSRQPEHDNSNSAAPTSHLPSSSLKKITDAIVRHQAKKQKQVNKLWRLSTDYQLFNAIQEFSSNLATDIQDKRAPDFKDKLTTAIKGNEEITNAINSLDQNGLISKMLGSRTTLYWEAIKSAYAPPGAVLVRLIERVPVFLTLGLAFGLGATPAPPLGEDARVLDWLSANPPDILGHPEPSLAADFVGTGALALALQEVSRLQTYRFEHIGSYLKHYNLSASFKPTLTDVLKAIAPEIESHHLQYMPDYEKIKKVLQEYHLTRRHPEADRIVAETLKNQFCAAIRMASAGVKEFFLRIPVDILGAYLNRQAKDLLREIDAHNAHFLGNNSTSPTIITIE